MHVSKIAITNYKSFHDRQEVLLEPGFNLLLGANNAGKTSILDALDFRNDLNDPHRSIRTAAVFGATPSGVSKFELEIRTNLSELRELVALNQLYLPLSRAPRRSEEAEREVHALLQQAPEIVVRHTYGKHYKEGGLASGTIVGGTVKSGDPANDLWSAQLTYRDSSSPQISVARHPISDKLPAYGAAFAARIYRFSADRRPAWKAPAQSNPVLDRLATTLPYCINHLQTNDAHGHALLCEWIARIFPSVKWVQAPPKGNEFLIYCLPEPPSARRDDLSVPMSNMGSGIGNVLAILYVVLTARHPQLIAIDEPNAFLHPRALRELLAILETEGRQHQYLLTAHSADVLTAVSAKRIALLQFDGVCTTVEPFGAAEIHHVRGSLADLGIRITDLHAKDRVLWVEGQTEEAVLPRILRWACPEVAAGTAILRVERTGTFSKGGLDPTEVANIYERLSQSSALVPPIVVVLLDGETHGLKKRQAHEQKSGGKLRYLPRRMLESYILHPAAIANALKELGEQHDPSVVESELLRLLGVSDLRADMGELHAAQALAALFSDLSEGRVEFRKTRDVPTIVEFILENEPAHLLPLRKFLRQVFDLDNA